jgi:hypothetical protein
VAQAGQEKETRETREAREGDRRAGRTREGEQNVMQCYVMLNKCYMDAIEDMEVAKEA